MALLVDTPRWPAHGTLYGHLVSDSSLWELHAGARRAGLDPRAFDHDHYDMRQESLPHALEAGAELVDERELVTRLRAGGLRIAPADHAPRRGRARELLRQSFTGLLPAEVVERIIQRHGGPTRHYHDVRHLAEMLRQQRRLAALQGTVTTPAEELATLFHDAVYQGVDGQDERDSAALAVDELTAAGHPAALVAEVERLVLLTIGHDADPDDEVGARTCDADMAILASAPGRYHVSVRDIRLEYGALDQAQWRTGRRAVLQHFLANDALFRSRQGRGLWLERARTNIADELAHLDDPLG